MVAMTKDHMEFARKLTHILIGVLIVLAYNSRILSVEILSIIIILLGAAILYNAKAEQETLTNILSITKADANIPGLDLLFYLLGCVVVLALFSAPIASAGIMILAFGDAVAHLVAKSFGGTLVTIRQYSEGTLFGILAGTLAAWLYVPLLAAFIASLIAMLIQAGELHIAEHRIDDNIILPFVACATLWLIGFMVPGTIA